MLFVILLFIGIITFFTFFHTKTAKNLKIGNTSSSQEIVDYILNISSYEAVIEVDVESNKNNNHYDNRYKKGRQKPVSRPDQRRTGPMEFFPLFPGSCLHLCRNIF